MAERSELVISFVLCAAIGTLGSGHAAAQGVRVVDAVNVGVAREEIAHGLHGEEMTVGETAGRKWRGAAGWFRTSRPSAASPFLQSSCQA